MNACERIDGRFELQTSRCLHLLHLLLPLHRRRCLVSEEDLHHHPHHLRVDLLGVMQPYLPDRPQLPVKTE